MIERIKYLSPRQGGWPGHPATPEFLRTAFIVMVQQNRKAMMTVPHPTYGGIHNLASSLHRSLAEQGYHLSVVTSSEPGNGTDRLLAEGVEVEQVSLVRPRRTVSPLVQLRYLLGVPANVLAIMRIVRRRKIELFHVCGLLNFHLAVGAKLAGASLVWHVNGNFAPVAVRKVFGPLVRVMADQLVCEGKAVRDAHPFMAKMPDRCTIVYPPVDTSRFKPMSAEARREAKIRMGVGPDVLLVGTVGNFNRWKGHDRFVEIAKNLAADQNLAFRLLGAPSATTVAYHEREVVERATSYGLLEDGCLDFLEVGDQVSEYLPAFDVFLLTSRVEGVATVTIEALACGVPVVAFDVGSVSEVVASGETGCMVPSGDIQAATEAVRGLLNDDEKRLKLASNCRARSLDLFSLEVSTRRIKRVYDAALGVPDAAPDSGDPG